ncbi:MAG: hypothetical protein CMJ48_04945 [Planctomycetaceae bacterium]|nr:hypothetical protein [Planctomycetaceae bacterium]
MKPKNSGDTEPRSGSEKGDSKEKGDHVNRRGFFTEGLRHLLRPVGDIIEQRLDNMESDGWVEPESPKRSQGYSSSGQREVPGPHAPTGSWLRPPGALAEDEFLETCVTSGQCVSACPVSAIRPAASHDSLFEGKPIIEARLQACVVCQDLACMTVCPTGALTPVSAEEIRMGTAKVSEDTCVRSQGEDCQICVDKCPLGPRAIDIPSFGAEVVVADGCVGCGVCEMYCPTEPPAIVVRPLEVVGGSVNDD